MILLAGFLLPACIHVHPSGVALAEDPQLNTEQPARFIVLDDHDSDVDSERAIMEEVMRLRAEIKKLQEQVARLKSLQAERESLMGEVDRYRWSEMDEAMNSFMPPRAFMMEGEGPFHEFHGGDEAMDPEEFFGDRRGAIRDDRWEMPRRRGLRGMHPDAMRWNRVMPIQMPRWSGARQRMGQPGMGQLPRGIIMGRTEAPLPEMMHEMGPDFEMGFEMGFKMGHEIDHDFPSLGMLFREEDGKSSSCDAKDDFDSSSDEMKEVINFETKVESGFSKEQGEDEAQMILELMSEYLSEEMGLDGEIDIQIDTEMAGLLSSPHGMEEELKKMLEETMLQVEMEMKEKSKAAADKKKRSVKKEKKASEKKKAEKKKTDKKKTDKKKSNKKKATKKESKKKPAAKKREAAVKKPESVDSVKIRVRELSRAGLPIL